MKKVWILKIKGEIPGSNEIGYCLASNRKEVDDIIDKEVYPYLEHRYGDDLYEQETDVQEVFIIKVKKTNFDNTWFKGKKGNIFN